MRAEEKNLERVPLTGMLAEFRTALEEEIEAAQRNSSASAVPLVNGRRVSQLGSRHQYTFDIESVLNLPGDTPGDLHIPGRGRVDIIVVAVEAMRIVLSVPEDLGAFIPKARLQSDLSQLMRRLIERIEGMHGKCNPVGDRVLGRAGVSGAPQRTVEHDGPLNKEQEDAVASSLGRDTTFIWGPPGTGKTRTIGSIGKQLYRKNRSVLLVSHTNTAVDTALWQISEDLSDDELADGHVIRVGEPRDLRLIEREELLLDTHVNRRAEELSARRERLVAERGGMAEKVTRLTRLVDLCEWVHDAASDIQSMARELEDVQALEAELCLVRAEQATLEASAAEWEAKAQAAKEAKQHRSRIDEIVGLVAGLVERREDVSRRLHGIRERRADAERLLSSAKDIAPLRRRAQELPRLDAQIDTVSRAKAAFSVAVKRFETSQSELGKAEIIYQEVRSVGKLVRMWRGLPKPEQQIELIARLRQDLDAELDAKAAAHAKLGSAEGQLAEVNQLAEALEHTAGIPEPEEQEGVVEALREEGAACETTLVKVEQSITDSENEKAKLDGFLDAISDEYGADPDTLLHQAEQHASRLAQLKSEGDQLVRLCAPKRHHLEERLSARLRALQDWGLTAGSAGTAEETLDRIRDCRETAIRETEGANVDQLRSACKRANRQVAALDEGIHRIDEELKKVEESVIADAVVVATTLTRAYLRDAIQNRRFDTVILDEAS
ncbi:MAG: AAA family ATPase, partial [Lentisphaerae bacterium]|nr:AAA family ATPase [Lentisphaerota bacterium]